MVDFRAGPDDQLGGLAGGYVTREVAAFHQCGGLGAVVVDAVLQIVHRLVGGFEALLGRYFFQALLAGHFKVYTEAVGVKTGLMHEFVAGIGDRL